MCKWYCTSNGPSTNLKCIHCGSHYCGACLHGDAGKMESLVKCANCGKKPGVKSNHDRGGWSDVSGAPCNVQGGPRYDGEGTHACFVSSLRPSTPPHHSRDRTPPPAIEGTGLEGDRPMTTDGEPKGRIADTFKKFDKNGDGFISREELKEVLIAISQKGGKSTMSDDHIDRLIEIVDVNGDGCIDYEEFVDWVTHPGDGADILKRMRTNPKPIRGPERFFYDKSSYTGAHAVGGPSIRGCGSYGKVNDLSEITRPASRSHTPTGVTRARPTTPIRHTPETPTRAAQHSAPPERKLVGPERFFYDKSSYTGVHTHGGPTTMGNGTAGQCNDLSEITRPASRGAAGGGVAAVRARSRPTTPARSSFRAPSAPATPARGHADEGCHRTPQKLVGPERFFYDKSSYTGCHKNGGPSSVAKGNGTFSDTSWKREC